MSSKCRPVVGSSKRKRCRPRRSVPGRGEVAGQLQPLRLAAAQGRDGLAEAQVAQPHGGERREARGDLGRFGEELARLGHGHVQHVGDGPPARRIRPAWPGGSSRTSSTSGR